MRIDAAPTRANASKGQSPELRRFSDAGITGLSTRRKAGVRKATRREIAGRGRDWGGAARSAMGIWPCAAHSCGVVLDFGSLIQGLLGVHSRYGLHTRNVTSGLAPTGRRRLSRRTPNPDIFRDPIGPPDRQWL